jgi:alpha-1,3-mannosyltransferase
LYKAQARKRYEILLGRSTPAQAKSWFKYWRPTDELGTAPGIYDDDVAPARPKQKRRDAKGRNHKYFFAINLYNSFGVIPDLFASMFRVGAILGYENVFISVYENGSNDQTKSLLKIFSALTQSVGMRVIIRTSHRRRGQFVHRIEYLAEVRNAALRPLYELRDSEGEFFDTIVFMNDVLPCVDDLLELIWQSRRQNAAITCAADYMYHDEIVSATSIQVSVA